MLEKRSVIYLGTTDQGISIDHRNDCFGVNYSSPFFTKDEARDYLMENVNILLKSGVSVAVLNGYDNPKDDLFPSAKVQPMPQEVFRELIVASGIEAIVEERKVSA